MYQIPIRADKREITAIFGGFRGNIHKIFHSNSPAQAKQRPRSPGPSISGYLLLLLSGWMALRTEHALAASPLSASVPAEQRPRAAPAEPVRPISRCTRRSPAW